MSLEGRTALVTGASGGLGAAFAETLVAAGAAVGLHYRSNEASVRALAERLGGQHVCTVQGELHTACGPAAICRQVEEALGPIDILINNGGGWVEKPLLDTSLDEWDELMQADVRGSFLTIQRCAEGMKTRGWGRIVNLSTVAALNVAADEGAYGVAKAAVIMLTKTAAVELAEFGVTVKRHRAGVDAAPRQPLPAAAGRVPAVRWCPGSSTRPRP